MCVGVHNGPLRIYTLHMQIRPCLSPPCWSYIALWFCTKHSAQLNPDCNEKMPTGFYLCQSIFHGLRDNHDAPLCHRHSLPSKGCITGSQSLEGYVIGKAHWTAYSCSLCAHSRDDIITKCFSHQILALPSAHGRAQLINAYDESRVCACVCACSCTRSCVAI